VVVSRLVERKGIGNVIEASRPCPTSSSSSPADRPPAWSTRTREALRFLELARRLGVDDRVQLRVRCRGRRSRRCSARPTWWRAAPWYEPFGLVAVEAMACGAPVIVSAVGGLAESVVHGVTGLHVPPRSPSAITDACALAARRPRHASPHGHGRGRRAQRFGWERIARETLAVAEELAAPRVELGRRSA
jgi:glycosyltransferase involved in cell wall biosynthesis